MLQGCGAKIDAHSEMERLEGRHATERGYMPPTLPTPDVLTVYGADWCWDCRLTKRHLDTAAVAYRYVDLEADRSAQSLLDASGYRAIPVVVTTDGQVLVEPSWRDLAAALGIAAA